MADKLKFLKSKAIIQPDQGNVYLFGLFPQRLGLRELAYAEYKRIRE